MRVRCLFKTLRWSIAIIGALSLATLGMAAFVWATAVESTIKGKGGGGVVPASVPAYAAVLAFALAIFVSSFVGLYGVRFRLRGPIFAFMILSITCFFLEIIGMLVLVTQLVRIDALVTSSFGEITLAVLGCCVAGLVLALVILCLLCIDPFGKSIYEKNLAWCGAGFASSFVVWSSALVLVFALTNLGLTVAFYEIQYLPKKGETPLVLIPSLGWALLGTIVASAIAAAAASLGIAGGKRHSYSALKWYLFIEFLCQAFTVACALVVLIQSGSVKLEIAGSTVPPEIVHLLSDITVMAAIVFVLSSFQVWLTFFVAVVMNTDADSVYRADYL